VFQKWQRERRKTVPQRLKPRKLRTSCGMAESHALSKPIFETRCSHPWKSGIAGCNSFLQRASKQQRGFENLMHALRILPLSGFLALIAALPPAVPAQSASFQVAQHGHAVGTASFRFTATPDGYDSTSLVRVAMQYGGGSPYSNQDDELAALLDQEGSPPPRPGGRFATP